LLDGGVPLWFLYGGALTAAVLFSYRSATLARTRTLRDAATISLGLQLTIICLCMSGPAFNTQLGILFWGVTGALFGAVQGDHRQHELMDYEVPVA
jgi:hypothetical protein